MPTTSRRRTGTPRNRTRKNASVRIPNDLNRMDPVSMNMINIGNAYIIKRDLVNKTRTRNGNTIRRKEVRYVYNKSTLKSIIDSGRMRSPVTRKPFTLKDVVKLQDIVLKSELNRYRKNRLF